MGETFSKVSPRSFLPRSRLQLCDKSDKLLIFFSDSGQRRLSLLELARAQLLGKRRIDLIQRLKAEIQTQPLECMCGAERRFRISLSHRLTQLSIACIGGKFPCKPDDKLLRSESVQHACGVSAYFCIKLPNLHFFTFPDRMVAARDCPPAVFRILSESAVHRSVCRFPMMFIFFYSRRSPALPVTLVPKKQPTALPLRLLRFS